MELSKRQEQIIEVVKNGGPITGEHIADKPNLTRATLRPDLAILVTSGFTEARPRVGCYYSGKSKDKLVSDHLRQYTIKDRMSLPVIVKEDTTTYDAICTIFLEDTGTLFITNREGELIGASSRKDLLHASMIGQDIHTMLISIIMSRMPNIVYLKEEDLVVYAASQMIDKETDSIPVVRKKEDSKYKAVGGTSKTTITKLFVSLFKE